MLEKCGTVLSFSGVQMSALNNILNNSSVLNMHLVTGKLIVKVLNTNFYNSDHLELTDIKKSNVQNLCTLDYGFKINTTQFLKSLQLSDKGGDNKNSGIIYNTKK